MRVQVVLVVCSIFLQDTFGATIQTQPTDANESSSEDPDPKFTSGVIINPTPTTTLFVSNATIQLVTTTVQPQITSMVPSTEVVKTDSNKTITFSAADNDTPLDLDDPKVDAKAIHNALTASTVDVHVIIKTLTGKTRTQRLRIAEEYHLLFKIKLTEDLKQKVSGWFKKLVLDLLIPLKEYYVKELHNAMHGSGTDEDALIEILCTMNNQQIKELKAIYEKTYKASLESHVEYDTSGYFEELLLALLKADRDESDTVDKPQAVTDAKTLYEAGEGKLGTDESTFITILTKRNYKQLKLMFDEYQTLTGHSMEYAIECEFSVFIKRGLLAIVKATRDLPRFYAERLHASMAGSGTNNKDLIRIVATRYEMDMDLIKKHFKTDYGLTLEDAIADDTSGDYKTLLLELVEENPCQYKNLLGCTFITIRNDVGPNS